LTYLNIDFTAGLTTIAADLQAVVDGVNGLAVPLWSLSSTTSSGTSSGTTETAVTGLTAPSSTYKAHSAYEIKFRTIIKAATTSGTVTIRIRDTNAAGTLRFDGLVVAVTTANSNLYYEAHVANTGGTDITSRILAVTLQHSAAGGALFNAATLQPYLVRCTLLGTDTDYPEAVAL
jgi:hypothetical protein